MELPNAEKIAYCVMKSSISAKVGPLSLAARGVRSACSAFWVVLGRDQQILQHRVAVLYPKRTSKRSRVEKPSL